MTGRTSGEFSRDDPSLRWQMNDILTTLKGINSDLTSLKISDAVMDEKVKTIAANAVDSRSRGWAIATIIISIILSGLVSYIVGHLK